jgi:hypothetical protein
MSVAAAIAAAPSHSGSQGGSDRAGIGLAFLEDGNGTSPVILPCYNPPFHPNPRRL